MFARAYATSIRPISLGRQLIGLLDASADHQPLSGSYVIRMQSSDLAAFVDVKAHLIRELVIAATQHCEKQGYEYNEPFSVVLEDDEAIKAGTFQISPQLTPKITTQPAGSTSASTSATSAGPTSASPSARPIEDVAEIISTPVPAANTALVLSTGQRINLSGETMKIGRHATCSVVFADSNVSREHAQLINSIDGWSIVDLGSTNGTKVNGVKIAGQKLLMTGDELAFGTSTARFEVS